MERRVGLQVRPRLPHPHRPHHHGTLILGRIGKRGGWVVAAADELTQLVRGHPAVDRDARVGDGGSDRGQRRRCHGGARGTDVCPGCDSDQAGGLGRGHLGVREQIGDDPRCGCGVVQPVLRPPPSCPRCGRGCGRGDDLDARDVVALPEAGKEPGPAGDVDRLSLGVREEEPGAGHPQDRGRGGVLPVPDDRRSRRGLDGHREGARNRRQIQHELAVTREWVAAVSGRACQSTGGPVAEQREP